MREKTALKRFANPKAECARLRSLYRAGVLRGGLGLSSASGLRAMRALVGPDCAYHLYGKFSGRENK